MPLHGRRFESGSQATIAPPPLGDGGSGSGAGSGGTPLVDQATGQGSIRLSKAGVLYSIKSDKSARVIFYSTNAAATADRNRKIGTPPKKASGVQGEFLFSAANQTISCDPSVVLENGDNPQTNLIYYRITNLSGGTTSVTLTLNYVLYK